MSATAWSRPTGTCSPITDAHCSSRLSPAREPVDPRGQDRLDGGRHQDRRHGLAQAMAPALPDENAVLDQRPDALLEKEGVTLRSIDQHLLEGREIGVVADERAEKLLRRFAAAADRYGAGRSKSCPPSRAGIPVGS